MNQFKYRVISEGFQRLMRCYGKDSDLFHRYMLLMRDFLLAYEAGFFEGYEYTTDTSWFEIVSMSQGWLYGLEIQSANGCNH